MILRLLVVKRLYHWSYEQTERFVADSLVLRQFCRVYLEAVPDDTTGAPFGPRWANRIGPKTVEQLNDRVVALARSRKVTRGQKLRRDSMVVETNIHYPTDRRLLGDGVRVLSRLFRRAKEVIGESVPVGKEVFRSRTRSVRRLAQQLHRGPEGTPRRKGEAAAEELKGADRKLIGIAAASRAQAEQVREALTRQTGAVARRLVEQFDHVLPLVGQGIVQATRRVLAGEVVPAKEKLLSLFEPHTQVIKRGCPLGRAGKDVEFGRKLWLEEVRPKGHPGIVSGDRILDEAGQDDGYRAKSLEAHQRRFGKPPWLVTGDRGVASPDNEVIAKKAGVKRVVLPSKGRASPKRQQHERQAWFRRGYRFRAGIEGKVPPGEGG